MMSIQAVKSFYYRPTRYLWRTPLWLRLWLGYAMPRNEEIRIRLRALRLSGYALGRLGAASLPYIH